MRLSRLITMVALTAIVGTASACGDSKVRDPGALGSTVELTPTTTAPTTATPTVTTPSPTQSPRTTATPTPDLGGDGDSEGDDAPATAGGGVCGELSASEVGAVLGRTLSGAGVPGGGCKFAERGSRGMSVTVMDQSESQAGGMEGAKTTATSAVEGEPQDLSGIGKAAFVVTGTMFGGSDVQGAGAVQVRNRIISVYLEQQAGLPQAKVRTLEVNLLKLVAREAS